jgi:hypothetical protein
MAQKRIPRCGYRADDAAPDPAVLDDFEYSAEGWLAALVKGRHPADRVREEAAIYEVGRPAAKTFVVHSRSKASRSSCAVMPRT